MTKPFVYQYWSAVSFANRDTFRPTFLTIISAHVPILDELCIPPILLASTLLSATTLIYVCYKGISVTSHSPCRHRNTPVAEGSCAGSDVEPGLCAPSSGKMSSRRPKLSTIKGRSAPKKKKKRMKFTSFYSKGGKVPIFHYLKILFSLHYHSVSVTSIKRANQTYNSKRCYPSSCLRT